MATGVFPATARAGSDLEERFGRRIALLSSTIGILLAAAKITVGLRAGSTAVVSDGLEAAGDVLSSAIVYLGLWLASKPPDEQHPYGHGRYETLAGLGVGGILLLAGAGILWHGLTTAAPHAAVPVYALYPLIAAVFVKVALAFLKFRVGRNIESSGLVADAWHDVMDLLSTAIAFLAVCLVYLDPIRFAASDRVGSLIIAVIVLFLSLQVVRRTVGGLLDTMPEEDRLRELRRIALDVPGARGIEKCYARRTGLKYHVDLHLEVDPEMTVRESHDIARHVKFAIKENLRWVADVLVHVEPHGRSQPGYGK